MLQPVGYHTPDAGRTGFSSLPELPFGKSSPLTLRSSRCVQLRYHGFLLQILATSSELHCVKQLVSLSNEPFPSCVEPHYESEAKCKVFIMKISFHSYANKTNFQMKSFAFSLAFIMRFAATPKWPIVRSCLCKIPG